MFWVTRHPSHWVCGIQIPRQEGNVHSQVPCPALKQQWLSGRGGAWAWHDPRPGAPLVQPGYSGRGLRRVLATPQLCPGAAPFPAFQTEANLASPWPGLPPSGLQAAGSPGRHCVYIPQLGRPARGHYQPGRAGIYPDHSPTKSLAVSGIPQLRVRGEESPPGFTQCPRASAVVSGPWVLWVGSSAWQHPQAAPGQAP